MKISSLTYKTWKRFSVLRSIELFLVRAWLARWFSGGGIVIGGCGRSGTTLLLGMLSAHSKICAIPLETDNLYPQVEAAMIIKWLYLSHCNNSEARLWCEKSPKNITNVPEILSFLGSTGKFLHVVRDGRDVITSKHPSNPDAYWIPIDRWVADVSAGLMAEEYPQVRRVRYEDLVGHPRRTLDSILEFLGEEFEENMLSWQRTGTVQFHYALGGKPEPLHHRSVGRWKDPEHARRIDQFMSTEDAKTLLARLNYL